MARRPSFAAAGSGVAVTLIILIASIALIYSERLFGWDATWRTVGVTPLEPHFFDMHVPIDYALCARKEVDPYIPHACNVANFNIPPIWLDIGRLGIDSSDVPWLSGAAIAAALAVIIALLRGRAFADGLLASLALLSPSVLMGVERANPDLLILSLVGGAALLFSGRKVGRLATALILLSFGVVLKLYPMFCVAVAARFSRKSLIFSTILFLISFAYLAGIFKYILLIRSNVPTTFVLSYGYKSLFLGLDHLRSEAGLEPFNLADTWTPVLVTFCVLLLAAASALTAFRNGWSACVISDTAAGTAFLFGGGIYCGTYLLGTNFIYRLMFLLLCLPQLLDWLGQRPLPKPSKSAERLLLFTTLSVLWLNGDSNGHTTFLLVPQLFNWVLFGGLIGVLALNLLKTVTKRGRMRLLGHDSVSAVGHPAEGSE